ncbi:MAG TPA: hypothetical protein VKV19_02345 [Ktedonobacteraceae bacterium]|nr:hypothetical protein [Ktedonobacteraceae bacterium]
MKERIITLAEVQQILDDVSEQFSEDCSALVITRGNQPSLTLIPYQVYQELLANVESLQTMVEIMLGGAKADLSHAAKVEKPCGESKSWEEFREEVGW